MQGTTKCSARLTTMFENGRDTLYNRNPCHNHPLFVKRKKQRKKISMKDRIKELRLPQIKVEVEEHETTDINLPQYQMCNNVKVEPEEDLLTELNL